MTISGELEGLNALQLPSLFCDAMLTFVPILEKFSFCIVFFLFFVFFTLTLRRFAWMIEWDQFCCCQRLDWVEGRAVLSGFEVRVSNRLPIFHKL